MEKITSPHDRYFRSAMVDMRVARDFFQHHLPENLGNLREKLTLLKPAVTIADHGKKLTATY